MRSPGNRFSKEWDFREGGVETGRAEAQSGIRQITQHTGSLIPRLSGCAVANVVPLQDVAGDQQVPSGPSGITDLDREFLTEVSSVTYAPRVLPPCSNSGIERRLLRRISSVTVKRTHCLDGA